MTHVITQNCCNDAGCVVVCPVNCIHPTPDEPDFGMAEMLYIDPAVCIDCGACLDACPVSAIYPDYELPEPFAPYEALNASYFADPVRAEYDQSPTAAGRTWEATGVGRLRVAVVGSGPAAFYAAEEVLSQRALEAEVDMFERLPAPGGLVRYGVAPDHQKTKAVLDTFARTMRRQGLRFFGNVEVGRDITHEQLTDRYHAVVYAVGATADHALGVPGEHLSNSHSATEFVAWYNGHPEYVNRSFDLSSERVVIIGNGNVAIDVARVLCSDPAALERTDVAEPALEVLRESMVSEVVIIGRRGPAQAAFTTPELMGLAEMSGIDIVVAPDEVGPTFTYEPDTAGSPFATGPLKNELLRDLSQRTAAADRRITFRFLRTPVEILGEEKVEGIRLVRNDLVRENGQVVARATGETEDLSCGLILRAVGYRASPVPDLPFDEHRSVLPHVDGRVVDPGTGQPILGVYATGWIKRGPSGVIGTNKKCARDTVDRLLEDFTNGVLPAPAVADDMPALLPDAIPAEAWRLIDAHERDAGRATSRPRVKLLEIERMLEVARTSS